MPGQAVRIGDQTIHGGVITTGAATVFIGGKPAARVGDMQSCPMASGTVPHAVTPIMPPGVPIVMIEGRPAACMGDPVGPPCLAMLGPGEPTVVIGTSPPLPEIPSLRLGNLALLGAVGREGGGSGKEGASGATAGKDASGASENSLAWIEIDFKQSDGKTPAAGIKYLVICPNGSERTGYLNANGFAREENIGPTGICEIKFPELDDSAWIKTGSSGKDETDWIDITLLDKTGEPRAGEAIEVTLPNGRVVNSRLDDQGHIRLDNIPSGTCKVRFPDLDESEIVVTEPGPAPEAQPKKEPSACPAGPDNNTRPAFINLRWSKSLAGLGETVSLTADVINIAEGESVLLRIFEQGRINGGNGLEQHDLTVTQGGIEFAWQLRSYEVGQADTEQTAEKLAYVFRLEKDDCLSELSCPLELQGWFKAILIDHEGTPIQGQDYVLTLADRTERRGKSDAQGIVQEINVPAGTCELRLLALIN